MSKKSRISKEDRIALQQRFLVKHGFNYELWWRYGVGKRRFNPRKYIPTVWCGKKIRYESKRLAKRIAEKRMAEGSRELWIYQCSRCDGWHLTHKRQPRR